MPKDGFLYIFNYLIFTILSHLKQRDFFRKELAQGEFDRALNGFLSACTTNISTKHSNSKFIFIFGDADFGHGTWSSFTDYAVPKLKSPVVFLLFCPVCEGRFCPVCEETLWLVGFP